MLHQQVQLAISQVTMHGIAMYIAIHNLYLLVSHYILMGNGLIARCISVLVFELTGCTFYLFLSFLFHMLLTYLKLDNINNTPQD